MSDLNIPLKLFFAKIEDEELIELIEKVKELISYGEEMSEVSQYFIFDIILSDSWNSLVQKTSNNPYLTPPRY